MAYYSPKIGLKSVAIVFWLLCKLVLAKPFVHGHKRVHSLHHRASFSMYKSRSMQTSDSTTSTTTVKTDLPLGGVNRSLHLVSSTTTATAEPSVTCLTHNDSSLKPGIAAYTVFCNVDFPSQDIIPFVRPSSLYDCIASCDQHNDIAAVSGSRCEGAVFVLGRTNSSSNCYRKYNLTSPNSAKSVTLPKPTVRESFDRRFSLLNDTAVAFVAVALVTDSTTAPKSFATSSILQSKPTMISLSTEALEPSLYSRSISSQSTSAMGAVVAQATTRVIYDFGKTMINPTIKSINLLGPSNLNPSSQWVNTTFSSPTKSPYFLSSVETKADFIFESALAPGTGTLTSSGTLNSSLSPLSVIPHLSRDGGKGGYLKGQHLFVFCDTASFTTTSSTHNGDFVGFVSNSVAIDVDMNGLQGQPLTLKDGIGQWNDSVGRLRGFAPMTTGEETFNERMSDRGGRFAVWPESSLIPIDKDSAILYANLIYDKSDADAQSTSLTYLGNTLLKITAGDAFGPTASRIVKRLFREGEIAWGSLGGVRSWGPSGIGGTDGQVYLFGKADHGVLLARCKPSSLADRSNYQYWAGESWASKMLPPASTAYLIDTPIMDFDLIYSPHHLTFLMVYMTTYVDNTFYYRFLNSSTPILPPYASGGDPSSDFVENIVKSPWSSERVLYRIPKPAKSFAYAGSVHQGYFAKDDITNGGNKMLLSWTAETGLDGATPQSGYALMTAVIEFL